MHPNDKKSHDSKTKLLELCENNMNVTAVLKLRDTAGLPRIEESQCD